MLQKSVRATALSGSGSVEPWLGWLKSGHDTELSVSCFSMINLGKSQRRYVVTSRQCSASPFLATESEVRIDTHCVHMQTKEILTEEIISIDLVTQYKFLLLCKIL